MTTLYIVSTKAFAGKTVLAVSLAKDAQSRGQYVRYFKPVGPYPEIVDGVVTDKDAQYVSRFLGVDTPAELACPVPMTETLRQQIVANTVPPLLPVVARAHARIAEDADLVIAGGMGSLFSAGISFGMTADDVAQTIDAKVLVVSRYKADRTLDELLTAAKMLNGRMLGAVINAVRADHLPLVRNTLIPSLEKQGIPIFGALPEEPALNAIPVRDLQVGLCAKVLTGEQNLDKLVEHFMIGAMTTESALRLFQKVSHKAVVTGSDRSDIIRAALETSLRALVLTGGFEPSPPLLSVAYERGVPVLLVREDTLTTVERINALCEQLRFRQSTKVDMALTFIRKHLDLERLWKLAGVKCTCVEAA